MKAEMMAVFMGARWSSGMLFLSQNIWKARRPDLYISLVLSAHAYNMTL